jgi:hypothetical protein
MLPRRDQNDGGALEALARANLYWIRFFAALRMTVRWESRRLGGIFLVGHVARQIVQMPLMQTAGGLKTAATKVVLRGGVTPNRRRVR